MISCIELAAFIVINSNKIGHTNYRAVAWIILQETKTVAKERLASLASDPEPRLEAAYLFLSTETFLKFSKMSMRTSLFGWLFLVACKLHCKDFWSYNMCCWACARVCLLKRIHKCLTRDISNIYTRNYSKKIRLNSELFN